MGYSAFGIGVIILAGAIIYALLRNRQGARNKSIGDAAAKEQFRHPDSYNPEEYRRELEPNPDGSVPRTDGKPGLQ